jgi:mono/diheme cytochrome c family protein
MGAFAGSRLRAASLAGTLAVAFAGSLALVGCGGCDSTPDIPASVAFPPRPDRLVLKIYDKPAPAMNTAGKRDEEIAALDAFGITADPAKVSAESRAALDAFLKDAFGTPAAPADLSAPLKLTKDHLAEGARLFKRHCVSCHNFNGDGRGMGGQFQVPFPRDYRQGAFKFTTTGNWTPRRADLMRTLHDGLKGTAMPAFSLLQEGERDLLAGYVTYLSIRGQVEFDSLRALIEGKPNDPAARLKAIVAEWEKADAAPALPAPPDDGEPNKPNFDEAVRRGYKLFIAKTENSCVSCHGDFGRKPVLRYDVWGTVAKPANFTEASFKGGSRPEDVYARIRFGIPAVGMPAHGPPQYSERDVWDLVRFTTSAPYPVRLPKDVHDAVYPNP